MEALKFVLKALVITMVLVVLMQVKVGNQPLEASLYRWLKYSSTSQYIQSAAAGGAMALRNLSYSLRQGFANTPEGFREGAHEKAVR